MIWYLDVKTRASWAYITKAFTPEECDLIIDIGNKLNPKKAQLHDDGSIEDALVDNNIRKSSIAFLDPKDKSNDCIFRRVTYFISEINKKFWNYDLQYIETLQFTAYKNANDFYGKHVDQSNVDFHYRKLSFSIQLSDPNSYEGSELLMCLSDTGTPVNKERGDMVFFPSFVLHEVTPLTKGERYSLVGWVCGPALR